MNRAIHSALQMVSESKGKRYNLVPRGGKNSKLEGVNTLRQLVPSVIGLKSSSHLASMELCGKKSQIAPIRLVG